MAAIKYKHNGEWKELQIPLTIVERNTEGNEELEHAAITSVKNNQKTILTDLTPYVTDFAQIELMEWFDFSVNGGEYAYGYNYLYWPKYNCSIKNDYTYKAASNGAYGVINSLYGSNSAENSFTIGGTPAAIQLIFAKGRVDEGISFCGTLHIYYRKEE